MSNGYLVGPRAVTVRLTGRSNRAMRRRLLRSGDAAMTSAGSSTPGEHVPAGPSEKALERILKEYK